MTIDVFPTSFLPVTPSSSVNLFADDGSINGLMSVANVLNTPITATGTNTARTLANRFTDVVNVLDWLASGQPDGTTDNTSQIQNAITAAAGKARVYIPKTVNNYVITTMSVPTNSHITVDGYLFLKAGARSNIFSVNSVNNVTIDGHGTLDGNQANVTMNPSCSGISSISATNLLISGLTITNVLNWPVNLTSSTNVTVQNCNMNNSGDSCEIALGSVNCWFLNNKISGITDDSMSFYRTVSQSGAIGNICTGGNVGISILSDQAGDGPCHDILIQDNIIYANTQMGVAITIGAGAQPIPNHYGIIVANNRIYNNTSHGIYVFYGSRVQILGNNVSGNANGIVIAQTSDHTIVANNMVFNNLTSGLWLLNASYCAITNNNIFDDQTVPTQTVCIQGVALTDVEIYGNYLGNTGTTTKDTLTSWYNTLKVGRAGSGIGVNAPALLTTAPVTIATNADTPSGKVLPFASTTGVSAGMTCSGAGVPYNTIVISVTSTTVTLNNLITADIPPATSITFACISNQLDLISTVSNSSRLKMFDWRFSAGSDWATSSKRIQHTVDSGYEGFIEFSPTGAQGGLGFGGGPPWSSAYGMKMSVGGSISTFQGLNATNGITTDTLTTSGTTTSTGAGLILNATGAGASMEIGALGSSNTPHFDFHSSGNNIDYDSRIIASGGTSTIGQGTLQLAAGTVRLSGGLTLGVRVVTAAGAITGALTDTHIIVNKTSGAASAVSLPASPNTGQTIIIKDGKGDANTNNITITPAAGNIDGSPTAVISTAYGVWHGVFNGTIWNTI